MTENEAKREMTFDEEYEILQREKEQLFSSEEIDCEPPFANCVVRRALRCIKKVLSEVQQYRAIGTVEDYWKLNEMCKEYSAIGTIEEFKALKEKSVAKKGEFNGI